MRRVAVFAIAALALAGALTTCRVPAIHPECSVFDQGTAVQIAGDDFAGGRFEPRVLCVKLGTRVTWRSVDESVDHTVSSVPGDRQTFDSGSLSYAAEFAVVFKKPGQYPYVCRFHPDMGGLITVLDWS